MTQTTRSNCLQTECAAPNAAKGREQKIAGKCYSRDVNYLPTASSFYYRSYRLSNIPHIK